MGHPNGQPIKPILIVGLTRSERDPETIDIGKKPTHQRAFLLDGFDGVQPVAECEQPDLHRTRLALDLFEIEGDQLIANLNIVEVIDADSAFASAEDLTHIIVEAPQ